VRRILVLNAGSSSVKFGVFGLRPDGGLAPGVHGQVDGIGGRPRLAVADAAGRTLVDRPASAGMPRDHHGAIAEVGAWLRVQADGAAPVAVGHRIVHGGEAYTRPVLVDDAVLEDLGRLIPLAPLHQPQQLDAIRAIRAVLPDVPQAACFDTSFHLTAPPVARAFALPREFGALGIRRYGFHGLSYEYVAFVLPSIAPDVAKGRVVVAHLGNGASLCAMREGASVATTMGLTALDGLVMGTRCGSIDPGVLLYLMDQRGMSARDLERLLYEESGLLGVSGISGDMRTLLASDADAAREAIDLFVYRISRELGSMAAALGGLDALVFTGGIGEHAAEIRARVCRDAAWLGIGLDEAANRASAARISREGSAASAWVVPTDENLMVARHTRTLVACAAPSARV
jgi:acetate kinase